MKTEESPFFFTPILNNYPEVKDTLSLPSRVQICDLTLDEDGEGMAGAYMSEDEKLVLAHMLDEIGIHRLGVLGYPSPISEENITAVKKITSSVKAKCQSLASTLSDVQSALKAGVWGVVLRKPCSDLYSVNIDPIEKKISDFVKLAAYARNEGLQVGMMAQDITRADPEISLKLIRAIHEEFGLDELCVTDSQGLGNPFAIHFVIQKLKEFVQVPIAVHCHNMLGMGVANACAAVAGGAEIVHTTVNGVGHFAGMPSTDEVAVALAIGYGLPLDIHYERFYELSKTVEKFTGIQMHAHKPVSGEMMFSRSEEAIHIQELIDSRERGILRNFYPYLPEYVGNHPRVVMGQKVTKLAVEYNLSELGISATPDQVGEIFLEVKRLLSKSHRIVSNEELKQVAQSVLY